MTDKTAGSSEVDTLLDTIRMSAEDRSRAYASLRSGELAAELVLRAAADMRAIVQIVERAAASLVRACKAMLAKPVVH